MAALRRVAVIGFGAIGRAVLEHLPADWAATGLLVRAERVKAVRSELGAHPLVVSSAEQLVALAPEVVLECAGQEAVHSYAETILAAGIDFVVIATGALADDELRERLADAARRGKSRVFVAAGAIGGLDALGALGVGGLSRVAYTTIKPPHAWLGTPAEAVADLGALREPTTIFSGSARDAARQFPKNANIALTVALAAGALDDAEITLVADPGVTENIGIVEAEGPLGTLRLDLRGPASAENPRTSAMTALSLVHELERRSSAIVV